MFYLPYITSYDDNMISDGFGFQVFREAMETEVSHFNWTFFNWSLFPKQRLYIFLHKKYNLDMDKPQFTGGPKFFYFRPLILSQYE